MLEAFVDLVLERRERDPGMHVYHYGGYESGALKRLMQRHATREDEIDVLLRGHVLVNLYDHVVRQGVRAGVESYSIKKMETFYMPQREGGITQAGFSVVEYERWMTEQDPAILDAIAAYNRDDCISNLLLRDWLEGRRDEALETHPEWYPDGEVPRPSWEDGAASAEGRRGPGRDARARGRAARRRARGPARAHARAAGPLAAGGAARLASARGEAAVVGPLPARGGADRRPRGRRVRARRAAVRRGPRAERASPRSTATGSTRRRTRRSSRASRTSRSPRTADGSGWDTSAATVVDLDPVNGTISLKRNAANAHPVALIPSTPFGTEPMRGALGRLADHVAAHGLEGPGRFRAARDLILRRPPRIDGVRPGRPARARRAPT